MVPMGGLWDESGMEDILSPMDFDSFGSPMPFGINEQSLDSDEMEKYDNSDNEESLQLLPEFESLLGNLAVLPSKQMDNKNYKRKRQSVQAPSQKRVCPTEKILHDVPKLSINTVSEFRTGPSPMVRK